MVLNVGDKYLSIKLVGHEFVAAFKNDKKTKEDQPDFKGDGIAVWVREKKPSQSEPKVAVKSENLL